MLSPQPERRSKFEDIFNVTSQRGSGAYGTKLADIASSKENRDI